jgi:hypothetical protein
MAWWELGKRGYALTSDQRCLITSVMTMVVNSGVTAVTEPRRIAIVLKQGCPKVFRTQR